jgi:ubiquinone biosynthesis protein
LPSLRTLPGHLEAVATQLRSGRLTTRVERYSGSDRRVVDAWLDRVTFAAVGLVGMISAALLLVAAALVGKSDTDLEATLQAVGFFGIVVTAVIQMRVVAQILRRDDGGVDRRV